MKIQYVLISLLVLSVVLLTRHLSLPQILELKSIDQRFHIRAALSGAKHRSTDIVIIGVDDKSIATIEEPFILWDTFFAQILNALAPAAPRVIGMDIIWAKSIDRFLKRPPKQRNAFKKALLLTVNKYKIPMVIGIAASIKKGTNQHNSFDSSLQMKHFGLILGKEGFGVINTLPDADKSIRRVKRYFQARASSEHIPSFAALIAAKAMTGKHHSQHSDHIQPPSPIHWINYDLNLDFPLYSFIDVLQKARAGDRNYFRQHFHNKVVLFGINNVSDDIHITPLATEKPGIFIHAHTIENYLHNQYLYSLSSQAQAMMIIIACLLTLLIAYRLSLVPAFFSLLLALFVYIIIVIFSFINHYIIPLVPVILVMFLTFVSLFVYRFTVEDKNKRRLAHFFRSYVNDAVVNDILKTDKPIELRGSRQQVCVLFSDIRNFTTYSESHDPEVVVTALNEYFSAMTEVILSYGGTVDKFIGDGLMAFFGAPVKTVQNPTLNALKSALAMREKLRQLNQRWCEQGLAELDNGIGLHTGEAIIGNIGSDKKMEYTAIGDSVNVASRIEGLTKQFQVPIIMSADSYVQVKNHVVAISKGMVSIKGHSDIEVFELIKLKEQDT